ncbi:MAG: NADPH-dependent FMN reductase [Propionibacteriaceae bacterium]|nr:NADPH-dependent FMN reductase [Propionibacteriaceae bacterium]
MSSILVVSGSPSVSSRSEGLARRVGAQLGRTGAQVSYLSVRDLPAEALAYADFGHPAIVASQQQLARADAVVIATPIYKASCSGLLKMWLDLLPQYGLEGKSVLPLATGGSLAHALALDYGVRPILSSMNPRTVVRGLLVTDGQITKNDDGSIELDQAAEAMLDDVIAGFIGSFQPVLIAA